MLLAHFVPVSGILVQFDCVYLKVWVGEGRGIGQDTLQQGVIDSGQTTGREGGAMRWDRLFDDLQAQLDADGQRELDLEVADRTRRERAQVGLHERFIAHSGQLVELRLAAGVLISGTVADAGSDWLLIHDRGDQGCLVPFAAIVSIND